MSVVLLEGGGGQFALPEEAVAILECLQTAVHAVYEALALNEIN